MYVSLRCEWRQVHAGGRGSGLGHSVKLRKVSDGETKWQKLCGGRQRNSVWKGFSERWRQTTASGIFLTSSMVYVYLCEMKFEGREKESTMQRPSSCYVSLCLLLVKSQKYCPSLLTQCKSQFHFVNEWLVSVLVICLFFRSPLACLVNLVVDFVSVF